MKYNIPRKFNKESRIFYIFTKKSLIYTGIGAAIGIVFVKLLTALDNPILGVIMFFVCSVPFFFFGNYTYSKDNPFNGGEDMDTVVIRMFRKKFNKKIYITKGGVDME